MANSSLQAQHAPENTPDDRRAELLYARARGRDFDPGMLLGMYLEPADQRLEVIGSRLRSLGYLIESAGRDPNLDTFAEQSLRFVAETVWDLASCAKGLGYDHKSLRAEMLANAALTDAWETFRAGYLLAHPLGKKPTREEVERGEEALYLGDDTFVGVNASSIPAVIAKLKRVLIHCLPVDRVAHDIVAGIISDETRSAIEHEDFPDRILWSAIEDLEQIHTSC